MSYRLEEQVGFLLRVLYQRNAELLTQALDGLTPTQWAVISMLAQVQECSQNRLGRMTAMDAATIKGVADRLAARGLVQFRDDPTHRRRVLVSLSPEGLALYERLADAAAGVSDATLSRLSPPQAAKLVQLLKIAAG
ncbi:MarR family winged helix-turn-helix transcriptional regulator [Pseudacidovorax sp. NFM-22]|uniref:MarR family winged helix-turn-helix transcriptional regulator n=1 Tax=Pseudacidovorax sp. NFM-22 TaxID=2744469 RepID=UPI001F3D5BF5|nr:MarR family transcriptional regulator [Pseudacidovorax sp. NFM-22]